MSLNDFATVLGAFLCASILSSLNGLMWWKIFGEEKLEQLIMSTAVIAILCLLGGVLLGIPGIVASRYYALRLLRSRDGGRTLSELDEMPSYLAPVEAEKLADEASLQEQQKDKLAA